MLLCVYMHVYVLCVYMHVYVCICIPKGPNLANLGPNRSPSWRQIVMLGWSWAQSDSDGPPNWCTWKSKSCPKWRNLGPFGNSFTPNWERCFKRSVRFEDFGLDRQCASFWNHMGFNLGRSCSQMGPHVGPSWAEVGALLPKLTLSRASVAAMSDRNCTWATLGRSANCANYHSPVHFLAPCSHLKLHQSDRSVRITPC